MISFQSSLFFLKLSSPQTSLGSHLPPHNSCPGSQIIPASPLSAQLLNVDVSQSSIKILVAHCKEYGFIFPSSEIYDGLGAVYDYGQLGAELKNNIKRYWWEAMTRLHENIVGIDSAIFMHPKIWEASGHVGAFNDPLIDNKDSKKTA